VGAKPGASIVIVAQTRPAQHVDISSTLHFCSIVSAFVNVRFYDYRPADLQLSGLTSQHADLTALPFPSASIASLSCLHVVEHIGLGRYGDPLDPNGDVKAIDELQRVLAPGGTLLFVVPVGKPRIQFNAHRIYSYDQLRSLFAGLKLKACALVPDDPSAGGLLNDPPPQLFDEQRYGCGCFWFQRSE
jgi:SAM-dependent methyltransferase